MKFETSIKRRMASRNKLCLAVETYTNKKVLDIGCSYGWFEKFVDAKEIIGIELNEKDLKIARKETKNLEGKKINFQVGSALDLKFKDKIFDSVVMFDVIEHVPRGEEREAVLQISRVLKDGGKLVLSTPANNFTRFLDPAWYFGHRHYSIEEIRKILGSDFKIEKAVIRGGFFDISGLFLFYFCKWMLNSEIPFKEWFDEKRDNEYLKDKSGFVSLYVVAKKRSKEVG